jgi:NitT/TauT family transport system substrate-binding protein
MPTASPTKQIFQLDKSYGADGMAVRNAVTASIKDLKGKTVAASAPGTRPISRSPGC